MDTVSLAHAKEHLEELIERARRGEDVRIAAADGVVRLAPVGAPANATSRRPGRWKDRLPDPPAGFFEPMSEEELKDWYGDDA